MSTPAEPEKKTAQGTPPPAPPADPLGGLTAAADAMGERLCEAARDRQQFYRQLVEVPEYTEAGRLCGRRTEERVYGKADVRAMRDMTAALRELADLLRDLHGLPAGTASGELRVELSEEADACAR